MDKNKYYIFGWIFLIIQILAILRNYYSDYFYFFWFCDFIPAVFAVLFFLKKENWIKGIINIGLIVQWIYLGIFFYRLYDHNLFFSFLPISSVILFYDVTSIIIHLSTTIALIALIKIKPTLKTLLYSGICAILLFLMTLLFTSPDDGINYVYTAKNIVNFTIPYYTELWLFMLFLLVIIPTQGIQYLLYIFTRSRFRKHLKVR